jgi:alanine dehydrogenase
MPGYLPESALEAKLISVFPGNHERGLPSHQGLIALFEEDTGEPLAIMDAVHITAIRTGATTTVAARALARPEGGILAILGAGTQGSSHLNALLREFEFDEVRIASRNPAHAEGLAAGDPRAKAVDSFEEAVRGADVVCCCTASREPVIRFQWLASGAHVSSVGTGRELDAATVSSAAIFGEWRGAVEYPPPAGAQELQGLDGAAVTEIGEVLAGARPGRRSESQITVYKSTGHDVEDAAAARLTYEQAKAAGIGQLLSL